MTATPEQLKARLEKARAARESLPKEPKAPPREFPDDPYWVDLARKHKTRLPMRSVKLTTGSVVRALKKLGLTNTDFREWSAMSVKAFVEANPTWTARSVFGLLLELKEEKEGANVRSADEALRTGAT